MSHPMIQSITTKFLGPTDTRGSRVKASCQARSLTLPWDHALDVTANHTAAALKLATALGWGGTWHGGASPDGTGNCYVLACPAFEVNS